MTPSDDWSETRASDDDGCLQSQLVTSCLFSRYCIASAFASSTTYIRTNGISFFDLFSSLRNSSTMRRNYSLQPLKQTSLLAHVETEQSVEGESGHKTQRISELYLTASVSQQDQNFYSRLSSQTAGELEHTFIS